MPYLICKIELQYLKIKYILLNIKSVLVDKKFYLYKGTVTLNILSMYELYRLYIHRLNRDHF